MENGLYALNLLIFFNLSNFEDILVKKSTSIDDAIPNMLVMVGVNQNYRVNSVVRILGKCQAIFYLISINTGIKYWIWQQKIL